MFLIMEDREGGEGGFRGQSSAANLITGTWVRWKKGREGEKETSVSRKS